MSPQDFHLNFDRAVQTIYEFKATRLSHLLSESDEVKRGFIRAELSDLDEAKRVLYSLNADSIEVFIQALSDKYSPIQA